MKILFAVFVAAIVVIEYYIAVSYGAMAFVFSLLCVLISLLIPQLASALGFNYNLFKKTKKDIKILDEETVIDGRILDIINSRFVSGEIVVPKFIVERLQRLSSSENQIDRARGRRGLDVIARLGENDRLTFRVVEKDYHESDIIKKIIALAKDLGASIVTTNFQMNKNAAIHNISVLNINDLALSLKPVVLPGEEMSIFIMKDGKEKNQGIGYLDDGTMVVVEDGYQHIGRKMDIRVQSILQTPTGRIIFAKIKFNEK
ncbi:MAG: hypothetical protein KA059_01320 [Elusimicrobiales bacterium]|jgi:uncharacterized protein YacL|nr:hypothetical protein [Elusimicrobiales bacterium]NLH39197.1 PIN domain nuclease [Elusimicrobiota bacterium]